jgi:replicative DNA helicase
MGKTSFAVNIAENVAIQEGLPVAVFSMEMGAEQLAVRIVGSIGRIDQGHLRTGRLSDDEWPRLTEALEKLRGVKLHIDETPGLTVGELRSNARRLARLNGGKLGLIVVDYLQLMTTECWRKRRKSRYCPRRNFTWNEDASKRAGMPGDCFVQLDRGVEQRTDKRPMMSDLRESGAIEQDADLIMFIYRDEYYTERGLQRAWGS